MLTFPPGPGPQSSSSSVPLRVPLPPGLLCRRLVLAPPPPPCPSKPGRHNALAENQLIGKKPWPLRTPPSLYLPVVGRLLVIILILLLPIVFIFIQGFARLKEDSPSVLVIVVVVVVIMETFILFVIIHVRRRRHHHHHRYS